MRDRVEGKGPRMDGGGRNDVDGVTGEKGGRVAGDYGVGEVGEGDGCQVGLGDVVHLGQGLGVGVRVDANGSSSGGCVVLQDSVLHRGDGGG